MQRGKIVQLLQQAQESRDWYAASIIQEQLEDATDDEQKKTRVDFLFVQFWEGEREVTDDLVGAFYQEIGEP